MAWRGFLGSWKEVVWHWDYDMEEAGMDFDPHQD